MEIHEQIQIQGEPFPKPLPMAANKMIALLKKSGFLFRHEDEVLRYRAKYDPRHLNEIKSLLAANGLSVDVWRTIWVTYDDHDFKIAPLWLVLGIPEIWVGVDFGVVCNACGRKRVHVDPRVRVGSVETRKPIVNVDGQFTIVRDDVATCIKKELIGAKLSKFDKEGSYHYLLSTRQLRQLIPRPDQVIGYKGAACKKCSLPIFETHFGPLRYATKEWKGEDIVGCNFLNCNAYTPKAHDLLKRFEKNICRHEVIVFE